MKLLELIRNNLNNSGYMLGFNKDGTKAKLKVGKAEYIIDLPTKLEIEKIKSILKLVDEIEQGLNESYANSTLH